MKVLFAVSNEEISEAIVKKYQKEYKQIISYKNVYYFNAIMKELQKDKSYDRIVISEDLEAFTHTQYEQIDKFIFEKLDGISDEATDLRGNDIPIILICSDRRTRSEEMLVKLFGIGVYNAIIGQDRSVDEVCRLINRPRSKKEAKNYYKIETENVGYQTETENDVSEVEIQNILAHYKRLGKNEDRYLDSFNNIAAQYNDTQLRIISKFLPLNVRAVLEERSPKYQQIMSFNNKVSDKIRKPKQAEPGTSEKLLKSKVKDQILTKPVVIPSSVNMNSTKKLARTKQQPVQPLEIEEKIVPELEPKIENQQEDIKEKFENLKLPEIKDIEEENKPVKRGRGRPRKNPIQEQPINQVKRGRGRPRKNPVQQEEEDILSGLSVARNDKNIEEEEEIILPGLNSSQSFEEDKDVLPGLDADTSFDNEEDVLLPGLNTDTSYNDEEDILLPGLNENTIYNDEEDVLLPGLSSAQEFDNKEKQETIKGLSTDVGYDNREMMPELQNNINYNNASNISPKEQYNKIDDYNTNNKTYSNVNTSTYFGQPVNETKSRDQYSIEEQTETIDLSYLMTPGKKIVSFVGTSKNGTSFIVNNLAQLISSAGVNTAILDTTQNRNSYYIYTKNEEDLRIVATHSIDNLANGVANGIQVNKNLTVYTSLPNEGEAIANVDKILETMLKQHSLILIDTDFETPINYFKQSQETYLVQTLDILTIQPLTAFLRELKARNILEEKKLRVILNKALKIKGVNEKTIIGGMAYYNDPAMSFMTELFDRNMMKYISLPFEEETYIRYLENIIECNISLRGYSKIFMQRLKELANMVYPMTNTYVPPTSRNSGGDNTFSPNINNTLNQMKNSY